MKKYVKVKGKSWSAEQDIEINNVLIKYLVRDI